jgi:hypothetical protein
VSALVIANLSDLRREQRPAAAYAVLGAGGLILSAALIVFGLVLHARRS